MRFYSLRVAGIHWGMVAAFVVSPYSHGALRRLLRGGAGPRWRLPGVSSRRPRSRDLHGFGVGKRPGCRWAHGLARPPPNIDASGWTVREWGIAIPRWCRRARERGRARHDRGVRASSARWRVTTRCRGAEDPPGAPSRSPATPRAAPGEEFYGDGHPAGFGDERRTLVARAWRGSPCGARADTPGRIHSARAFASQARAQGADVARVGRQPASTALRVSTHAAESLHIRTRQIGSPITASTRWSRAAAQGMARGLEREPTADETLIRDLHRFS
jgi:hypothetical protein